MKIIKHTDKELILSDDFLYKKIVFLFRSIFAFSMIAFFALVLFEGLQYGGSENLQSKIIFLVIFISLSIIIFIGYLITIKNINTTVITLNKSNNIFCIDTKGYTGRKLINEKLDNIKEVKMRGHEHEDDSVRKFSFYLIITMQYGKEYKVCKTSSGPEIRGEVKLIEKFLKNNSC